VHDNRALTSASHKRRYRLGVCVASEGMHRSAFSLFDLETCATVGPMRIRVAPWVLVGFLACVAFWVVFIFIVS
jgi:hypothetical protein